jgi:hypothetical protein
MNLGRWKITGGLMLAAALAACSGTEGPQGPGPMLADNACAQLRTDLNAMDKRGVPGMIDARNNGKKFAPAQDAEISRYNQVLDQYLGGQCASEARYKQKAGIPQASPSGKRASADRASGVTTASIPANQGKRRKPVTDDDDQTSSVSEQDGERKEKAAARAEQAQDKPARRKTARSSGQNPTAASTTTAPSTASIPAPTPVKAESGLPAAPAPVKAEAAPSAAPSAVKEDTGEKKE